ncbi:hypothetical protein [Kocuria rosea]|uniref:hypothetical protein n=1 Tax=Kocuria rosea TaxID=1275 RepID=UPI000F8459D5|nr:hypothetical protein [Kocuria rosea]
MMKRSAIALLALFSLVLTGCSGAEAEPEPTAPNVEAPAGGESEEPDENLSSRGNRVLEPGDVAVVTGFESEEHEVAKFVIKGIEVDPTCTGQFPQESENGHLVAVEVEVETGPEPGFSEGTYGGNFSTGPEVFRVVDKNGTTLNSATSVSSMMCFDQSEQIPSNLGAGERATGKMVLDVPSTEGVLIYDNFTSPDCPSFEWNFPSATVGA